MFSSVDSTEEKDVFPNSKGENVSATVVYESHKQWLVEVVYVLPWFVIATGGCGITVCWEKDYSKP